MKPLPIFIIISLLLIGCFPALSDESPALRPDGPQTFKLTIVVRDSEGNSLRNATVNLVTKKEVDTKYTNNNGIVVFEVDSSIRGETGTLIVYLDNYQPENREAVLLSPDDTVDIQLRTIVKPSESEIMTTPSLVPPTQTFTSTSADTATASPFLQSGMPPVQPPQIIVVLTQPPLPPAQQSQPIQPSLPTQPPHTSIPPTPTSLPTATVFVPPCEAGNLIKDCGFERNEYAFSWEFTGSMSLTQGQSGSWAVCTIQDKNSQQSLLWAGATAGYSNNYYPIPVTPGQQYRVAMWLRSENVVEAHIKVAWYDVNKNEIKVEWVAVLNGTTPWSYHGSLLTAPPNAVSASIHVWHGVQNEKNFPGGVLCMDNVEFKP
jgi:hypothetical protein